MIIQSKLQNALETGAVCGLETVGESVMNIGLHAGMIMSYTEIPDYLKALDDEVDVYVKSGGSLSDPIPKDIVEKALKDEQDYRATSSDSSEQKKEDNSIFG